MARNTGRDSRYAAQDPHRHQFLQAKARGGRFGKPVRRRWIWWRR